MNNHESLEDHNDSYDPTKPLKIILPSNKSVINDESNHSMPSPQSPKIAQILYKECYQQKSITHGMHRSPSVRSKLSSLEYMEQPVFEIK